MRRSTPKEIEEMKRLHKRGWTSKKIGKRIRRDSTTVLYHLGRINKGTFDGIGDKPSEVPEFIRKNVEVEEAERKNTIEENRKKKIKGYCRVCGSRRELFREENKAWRLTNCCDLKCFINGYVPRQVQKCED